VTNTSSESTGILYIVATPLGNLADLSSRAAEVLRAAALVAAEDTRRTSRLLSHLGLEKPQLALHEHNEELQTAKLIEALTSGRDVALVSDAGTPLISDPGLRLVRAAAAAGLGVVAVPGPSAVTAALSVAGLPTDRFAFEGFLPRRSRQRRVRLAELEAEPRTLVFFEAVHRLEDTLADMVEVFGGERPAVLARELSKLHEQVSRGRLADLAAAVGREIPLRGEFVIVVGGAAPRTAEDAEVVRIYELIAKELPPARAVALCARISGRPRNAVYALTRAREASDEGTCGPGETL
jgi:16S rRNA (cytidine1402-2'-O)-methyltransferase